MDDSSLTLTYKQRVILGGVCAGAFLLASIVAFSIFPISESGRYIGYFLALSMFILTVIYQLIFLNVSSLKDKNYSLIIDLLITGLVGYGIFLLGSYSYVYVYSFLILLAIEAFILPLYQYAILFLFIIVSIFFGSFLGTGNVNPSIVFDLGAITTIAIMMRVIYQEVNKIWERDQVLKRNVEELENDKRQIRALLESLSDGMFVVNAQNNITFYNKSALRILNMIVPDEKILGRNINDFLPTIGPNGPELVTQKVFAELKPSIRSDFRIVGENRTIKLETNISPVLNEKNKLTGAIIFFRDITKEKRVEEQRAEFNAIASHELRTPLTVIEGYLYFLLDPSSKLKYDKDTKKYLENAHQATQDLIRLVTDVLTVVKTEDKDLDVSLKKVNIKEIATRVIKDYQSEAKNKNLKLKLVINTKNVPIIISDPVKIKEMITNLVNNALKFTEKGSVTAEIGKLEHEIIFSVTDSGIGIDESEQKLIFDKFYRSENWRTRKTGGTGLGLYILKILAERLGGRIGVHSTTGKGSKFYFTLPIKYKNKSDIGKSQSKELKAFVSGI